MGNGKKYRILCIDGGGIRGIIPCILLRRLEEVFGAGQLLSRVDLFAGTSTGAIIAAALACGEPVERLEYLYQHRGREVFSSTLGRRTLGLWGCRKARYHHSGLKRQLREIFGSRKLGDLEPKLLITAFDLDTEKWDRHRKSPVRSWRPKVFHNFDVQGGSDDRDVEIALAVAYSCSGPTYFPALDGYVDGGVFANSPTVCALAQCLDRRQQAPQRLEDLVLLSLGTGRNPRYIDQAADWGRCPWMRDLRIIHLLMEGSELAADYQCQQLLGERYHRLAPTLLERIEMDDVERLPQLIREAQAWNLTDTIDWIQREWL